MTQRIPQSTAFLCVFKAYLSSDHVTEATSKTIAITISKNGGAFGNPNAGATNATEIASGWYKVALDTTDTATLGPIAVRGAVALIDDFGVLLEVVSATSGGYTNLDAAVTSRLAPTVAARTLDVSTGGEAGLDWANVGSPTTSLALTGTTIAVTQKVDVDSIKTSSLAASNLESGAVALVPTTCAVGSTTTLIVTNLTEATDDHYNGRVITFTSGALTGQASNITHYNGTTKTLTVTALTEAPANTDALVIS